MKNQPQFPEAELARLADGSLPLSRAAELRAQAGASPELTDALAAQERVVSLLRALDEPAPSSLQHRVGQMTAPTPARPGRRRVLALPVAALAAAAVVVVLASGSGSAAPTVSQAAQLAVAGPTMPAPAPDAAHADLLSLRVDGVAFPYYNAGWEPSGSRTDSVARRRIVTVFYTGAGVRVGYAIVPGSALAMPPGRTVIRDGVRFVLGQQGTTRLVSWLRSGHTCVIAGRSVSDALLLALASD